MLLYIVRHAHAGQHGDPTYPDDSLRPLTSKGRKQFRRVAKKLVKRDVAPSIIATSPLVRCRQTAEILHEYLDRDTQLVDLSELAPGSELGALIEWTNQQSADEVAWVGHAPDVDRLAAALVDCEDSTFKFAKGGVAAIAFAEKLAIGEGRLDWLITPDILGC